MEFRNVTVHKACALRSHHTKRVLAQALRFLNLCLVLFLLSRSSCFRAVLFHSFALFASLFHHPFYVFLLQNLIIFFIFALSHRNHHFPHTHHRHPRLHPTADSQTPDPSPPHTQTLCSQVVLSPVPAVAEKPKPTRSETTLKMRGNKVSNNNSDCYRRVRSENLSGRIVVGGRPGLNGLNAVGRYGGELGRRLCSVDKLSKEDFNRTVEEYIAKHRRMLWQEHKE